MKLREYVRILLLHRYRRLGARLPAQEFHCSTAAEYSAILGQRWVGEAREYEERLARINNERESWHMPGYCAACRAPRDLLVDRLWGGSQQPDGLWVPSWRERLECTRCLLNCRQRYMAGLLRDAVEGLPRPRVYLTERVTRFFNWADRTFNHIELTGSEYLPDEESRRHLPQDVPHEDVEELSFDTASLDLVVSNDVFEHINDPGRGARELARVLRPGGTVLLTAPMQYDRDESVTRARIVGGRLEHNLEPVYHGNPVDAEGGSLVFTDFGWDIVTLFRSAGFKRFDAQLYWSVLHGYLGGPHVVLIGER